MTEQVIRYLLDVVFGLFTFLPGRLMWRIFIG